MKLLYIADGRSPIALNWISYFIQTGHEVHLASTFPCMPIEGIASLTIIPIAMSGAYGQAENRSENRMKMLRQIIPVGLRTRFRQWVAPLTFPRASNSLRELAERIQPDLFHAMRIPYEGMVASVGLRNSGQADGRTQKIPLLISVWGNDFTLHAKSTAVMGNHTRQVMRDSDALHTDCQRDLELAIEFGFTPSKPSIVLPGGGGVKLDLFFPAPRLTIDESNKNLVNESPVTVINPRGFRAYVRNDTFFRAIPLVLSRYPDVRFICPGMAGEDQANKWIAKFGIGDKVDLLPIQSQQEMANQFRRSQISLSITTHDGTPNSLLEAMACGCFPIAGDIQSIREWISEGENGFLVDPGDPEALANSIINVISHPELRRQARERNLQMVKERAKYETIMQKAEAFYGRLISKK